MSAKQKSVICQLSHQEVPFQHAVKLDSISNTLLNKIKEKQPAVDVTGYVGTDALNRIREESIKEMLESDKGEISKLDAEVLENIKSNELISLDLKDESNENESFGIRLADHIAEFGGSWKFIIIFGSFILVWIASNIYLLANKGFDPYPFILLNLILSCLAALQAPVIMMSQNRMEAKDRKRAENDYKINLKAELEIRHLHEKIDHLIMKQMQHLNEIQQIQIELLEEINNKK